MVPPATQYGRVLQTSLTYSVGCPVSLGRLRSPAVILPPMQHRIHRTVLAWLLVAAIAVPAGAQAVLAQTSFGGIVGFVFQCTNGQSVPVANANVAVSGGPSSGGAKTTTTGDFTISGLAPGIYTVTASAGGQTATRN